MKFLPGAVSVNCIPTGDKSSKQYHDSMQLWQQRLENWATSWTLNDTVYVGTINTLTYMFKQMLKGGSCILKEV